MENPEELLYTREHEWIRVEDEEGTFGITAFAQEQLGDVVYVELPAAGSAVTKGEAFGVIESVKAVSDLFAPVSGEVLARNDTVVEAPEIVNDSPYEKGWLIRVRLHNRDDLKDLLSAAEYQQHIVSE